MANPKPRKAIREDVMDELMFISGDNSYYTASQRQQAKTLLHALDGTEWNPETEIKKVVDIYDNHAIEIPKYPNAQKAGVK